MERTFDKSFPLSHVQFSQGRIKFRRQQRRLDSKMQQYFKGDVRNYRCSYSRTKKKISIQKIDPSMKDLKKATKASTWTKRLFLLRKYDKV